MACDPESRQMRPSAAALSAHRLRRRTAGTESSRPGATAAPLGAQLRCNFARQRFLGRPKAKGERAHVTESLVRTSPLIKADTKNAQCKQRHPQTLLCAHRRACGTGREHEEGQGGSCGEACGFGQRAGNVDCLRDTCVPLPLPRGLPPV